jgi:acyl dehydratase
MERDDGHTYLEEIEVGLELVSEPRTLTADDIATFADLTGDRNPLHADAAAVADGSPYDAPIAHGLLVTSISSGQPTAADRWALGIYLEAARRFVAPVEAGDAIHTRSVVTGVRRSRSNPARGVVTLDVSVVNQRGEIVQDGTDVVMVGSRRGASARADQPRSK